MKAHYDFSDSSLNPYVKQSGRPISIYVDAETIEYFESLAEEVEIDFNRLISLYLKDRGSISRWWRFKRD